MFPGPTCPLPPPTSLSLFLLVNRRFLTGPTLVYRLTEARKDSLTDSVAFLFLSLPRPSPFCTPPVYDSAPLLKGGEQLVPCLDALFVLWPSRPFVLPLLYPLYGRRLKAVAARAASRACSPDLSSFNFLPLSPSFSFLLFPLWTYDVLFTYQEITSANRDLPIPVLHRVLFIPPSLALLFLSIPLVGGP